ncbi:triphosphoribosyl-dephospho-CoA synthase MdcB [Acetobacter sp. DsW_063]|uniref:triphosphoribosyl-dephospho-CoA synthase MdcB n=1 Tax=Acetobacter sp. DsW_063 TaxID=1514894 RepID=UPI000A39AC0E|nr:triphosphoribosyl-dephospho-CoA synthase MdcB [Acetobacter sp. DsW_063]OUJ16465.1 triphosphoribosyl-dephospho-CoA synthase [Acetobacter sp. DsW_063]
MNFLSAPPLAQPELSKAKIVAQSAHDCLIDEIMTWPKPGLVSHVDSGSHRDMSVTTFIKSASAIEPFFESLYAAGHRNAALSELRRIGLAAERAMLEATNGVNTHRGAIWGLGLLCAAAGWRAGNDATMSCGEVVRTVWGEAIRATPVVATSNGGRVCAQYGVGGARLEAANGFPVVHKIGVAALRSSRHANPTHTEAARVQCCMALIAAVDDTNLLHRGGVEGLRHAQESARAFLCDGGVNVPGWKIRAAAMHADFVARNLSPGGAADGLAMSLFVEKIDPFDERF